MTFRRAQALSLKQAKQHAELRERLIRLLAAHGIRRLEQHLAEAAS